MPSQTITVTIEAHPKNGVESLSDVARQMNAMVRLLTEFAARPDTAEVKVLSLAKHSPLVAEIQVVNVVQQKRAEGKPKRAVVRPTLAPVNRLDRIVRDVRDPNIAAPRDLDGLISVRECARLLRDDRAIIEAPNVRLDIDRRLSDIIGEKLGPVARSRGSVTGVLEGLNVHLRPWSFTIYPTMGAKKVKCYFKEDQLESVRKAVTSMVTVTGLKEFFRASPWPVRMQADAIEVRHSAPAGAWLTLSDDLRTLWDEASPDDRQFFLENAA